MKTVKEYRFDTKEVNVNKIGDITVLFPQNKKWNSLIESLDMFTDDYMKERNQGQTRERNNIRRKR